METTYRAWEKRRQGRESGRRTASRRQTGAKMTLGAREKRRLAQLGICIVLFLAVFIGKGVLPKQVMDLRDKLLNVISADTDFKAAFSSLGYSISQGEPVLDTLGNLWVDVFGVGTVTVPTISEPSLWPSYQKESDFLFGLGNAELPAAHWVGGITTPPEQVAPPPVDVLPAETTEPEPVQTPAPVPAVETMAYDGPTLPTNATMDKYNLSAVGVDETVSPVLGWVSSSFGWRDHPVDGGEKFHNGVDLAVNDGTEVLAFASGVVEYIGDNPDVYGKYIKIDHIGGLSTFYAHCSEILVQQGQTVTLGQTIAHSGETGNATGPHLHFEMKLNGTLLNPMYYIQSA